MRAGNADDGEAAVFIRGEKAVDDRPTNRTRLSGSRLEVHEQTGSGVDLDDRTALFISVHLDGIMVASMVRSNFNIAAAMDELRRVFWQRVSLDVERAA